MPYTTPKEYGRDLVAVVCLALLACVAVNGAGLQGRPFQGPPSAAAQGRGDEAGQTGHGHLPLREAHRAVWEVHNRRPGEAFGSLDEHSNGTAFAWGPRDFFTSLHVLRGVFLRKETLESITVWQEDRVLTIDHVVAINAAHDMAYIRTKEEVDGYLGFTRRNVSANEPLVILGYKDGSLVKEEVEQGISYQDGFFYGLMTDIPKLSGLSGGPILNSDGLIVGTADMAAVNLAYGIKSPYVIDFLSLSKEGWNHGVRCGERPLQDCLLDAARDVERMADGGDIRATYELGAIKSTVNRIDPDLGADNKALLAAVKAKFPLAAFDLARLYIEHERSEKAFSIYKALAAWPYPHRHIPSVFELGRFYVHGWAGTTNRELGLSLVREAAVQGFLPAVEYLEEEGFPIPVIVPVGRTMQALKRANVRNGAGTQYDKVDVLEVGQQVRVTGEANDWLRVQLQNGRTAFVHAPLLIDMPGRLVTSD